MTKAEERKKPVRRASRPLFSTLSVRVKFLLLMTVFSLAAVGAYEFREMRQAHRDDALAANRRYADAATAAAAGATERIRTVLTELGEAMVGDGGIGQCESRVLSAGRQDGIINIGVATERGTVICESVIDPKTASIADRQIFKRAAASGSFSVGDASGQQRRVSFAYPARGRDGRIAVIAFATADVGRLAEGLFPGTGYVAGIADDKGRDMVRVAPPGGTTGTDMSPELAAELLSVKNGTALVFDADGVERAYSFRASSAPSSGHLYFYAGTPAQDLFAASDRAAWRVAIAGGLLAALILWLMLTVGDIIIARRARKLAHAMLDIAGGDAAPDSLPKGFGELEGITDLFGRLAQELDKTKKATEETIRSRTSVLEFSKGITELEKARTEALLASISYGVVATDEAGKVSFFNGRARDAMWWSPDKAIGVAIHSVFQLEDEKENIIGQNDWPTRRALEQGEVVVTPAPTKPFYIRRQDKTRFPVMMTVSPVKLDETNAGAMVIFRDITDEVEFDRRKSEFISIASHQLRSPMAAMKWMSFMLRGGDFGALNPKQQEWADKVYKTAESMVELVNELLNISRLETGIKIHPRENDTAAFLDEVLAKNEPMLLEKKQKYAFARRDLPKLVFDPMMIGEVIKNLLSNASKYSPANGQVELAVTPGAGEVRFAIKDQGLGIPKADQKKLFSKFFRAANVIKDQIQGTGLGLYYCKSAVEVHGGQVGFDSEEGKGSTFWFTLPLQSPLTPEAAEPSAAPPAPAQ